ncbi:synaptojanin-2-binding protein isoform X2 [Ailuropoda melanoleuca]|uniref:synaptojanin-2-binding protein isoform X2 n=1 Tax=Ailuropoda melanoleuca TaxID=9646 RepID=UPI001494A597|nr:synaptojanin-2-binding protein isoform X2 [Ailuropoda melanoleuca]XP_034499208.1 synaptojanin-2-binding protein isoform X2 [Ailuropoda melanoleuca]
MRRMRREIKSEKEKTEHAQEEKVNGQDLRNLLHQDAVDLFRNAGYAVSLRVQHRLQVQNGPIGHRSEGEPSGIPTALVLLPVFALTVVAAWAFMRYRQQL